MTYSQDIDALNPVARYELATDANDSIGSLNGTNAGGVFTGPNLCLDSVGSWTTNGVNDRITLPTTPLINNAAQSRKAVCGWFSATGLQSPPKSIYGDGNEIQSFRLILSWGNTVMFEVNDPAFTLQIFSDITLAVDRAYHLTMVFEGNGFGNELRGYVDGVKQFNAEPINRQPDATTLTARSAGEFGDPAGVVGVGGTPVILLAPINGNYAQWAFFDGANAQLTDTQIREELFEKGAIPDVTITSQLELDAISSTVRPDSPLCILVDVSGSISLTADNITFSPLASIHVQYNGTGTLTWTNSNGSNASIGSTTAGGTINFVNPATLTINGIINGAEVRIYDDEIDSNNQYDTELSGVESNVGTSFTFNHDGSTNDIVIQMLASGYKEVIKKVSLSSSNSTETLFPEIETNE
jgi:hypothetical protein